jgi:hypothetical protein
VEKASEAGASELDADEIFAAALVIAYVNDFALSGEIRLLTARTFLCKRNVDFEVGANSHIEAGDEGRSSPAQIFAGSFLDEAHASRIASPDGQRQADGNAPLRARPLRSVRGRSTSRLNHARPPSVDQFQVNRSAGHQPVMIRSNTYADVNPIG